MHLGFAQSDAHPEDDALAAFSVFFTRFIAHWESSLINRFHPTTQGRFLFESYRNAKKTLKNCCAEAFR